VRPTYLIAGINDPYLLDVLINGIVAMNKTTRERPIIVGLLDEKDVYRCANLFNMTYHGYANLTEVFDQETRINVAFIGGGDLGLVQRCVLADINVYSILNGEDIT